MLGSTHDLTAFTALLMAVVYQGAPKMSIATAVVAIIAAMIGGLMPDIDDPSSDIWDVIPIGEILGKISKVFMGKHRHFSHSVLGTILIFLLVKLIFDLIDPYLLVDYEIVFSAFKIGFISHLVMDSLTKEGIPILWPVKVSFGFPPLRFLRVKTGGFMEKIIIFPGLLVLVLIIGIKYRQVFWGLIVR